MDYNEILKEQMNQVLEGEDFSSISEDAYRLSGGLSEAFTLENILNATLNGESVFQMLALIFLTHQKLRWKSSVHLWSVLSLIKDKNLIKYRIIRNTNSGSLN